jgi:imidazolonepropionase-like amidohydrolase
MIEPGKQADMIILSDNPVDEITTVPIPLVLGIATIKNAI